MLPLQEWREKEKQNQKVHFHPHASKLDFEKSNISQKTPSTKTPEHQQLGKDSQHSINDSPLLWALLHPSVQTHTKPSDPFSSAAESLKQCWRTLCRGESVHVWDEMSEWTYLKQSGRLMQSPLLCFWEHPCAGSSASLLQHLIGRLLEGGRWESTGGSQYLSCLWWKPNLVLMLAVPQQGWSPPPARVSELRQRSRRVFWRDIGEHVVVQATLDENILSFCNSILRFVLI